jgi:hypothetical protein
VLEEVCSKQPPGMLQNAVHAFDDLAERPGIEAHQDTGGIGDGCCGKLEFVMGGRFESAVEDDVLLAAVGDDFNLTDDDVFACISPSAPFHAG